jgi:muramidase (phage lysozyme)
MTSDGTTNLQAFLAMISACEGTPGDEGYRALFGYQTWRHGPVFSNTTTHPNVRTMFNQTDGRQNFTTAAGKYQEIKGTFDRLSTKLGTTDFSPTTQDLHAAELIAECGAMDDVLCGRLQSAIDKCAGIWASLPASHYPQPTRSYTFALNAFMQADGQIA